jgi:hypothetical protein
MNFPAMSRPAQIVCHLRCLLRQLVHLHLDRVPFHIGGIARALHA